MSLEFRDNDKATINSTYKPKKAIQAVRRKVYERYNVMQQGRQHPWGGNLESKWKKWNQQYEAWRPPKQADDWQSTIVPPFTTTIVERAISEMIRQALRPSARPRGPEDATGARVMDYALDYTWDLGDGDIELYHSIKQGLVLGTTIWQEYYHQDKRLVKELKKFDFATNEEEYVEKEIYDYDEVYGETVPINEFFLDPTSETINRGPRQAQDAIRRYLMSYDSFMENFKGSIWDQFGHTKHVVAGGDSDMFQFYNPVKGQEDKVELLMYWAKRPDKLVIMANDVVIRDAPNPYNHKKLPFSEWRDVSRVKGNGFYAMGESELLESIQDELTTSRRMRTDRQHLDIYKTFLVSDRSVLDEDEAIVAPSRFITVDDPNSVKTLEYGDINPSAYREEELLKADGRAVTGIESPQPSSSTATEAAILKETTMRALEMKIWMISRSLLKDVSILRASNITQFWTLPKASRLLGPKSSEWRVISTDDVELGINRETGGLVERKASGTNFFTVEPELITPVHGSFDFRFKGEPSLQMSQTLRQQRLIELFNSPVMASAIENGYYDANKAADLLVREHSFDAEEFKADGAMDDKSGIPEQVLIELAEEQNRLIAQGEEIPPTAYAPFAHTNLHITYMDSEEFKNASRNPNVIRNMMYHILGELEAQKQRGGEGAQGPGQQAAPPGGAANTEATGIFKGEAKAANPAQVLGPELTPQGNSR